MDKRSGLLERIGALQVERPGLMLLFATATVAAAIALASRLELKTSFGELLPANKESVIVADKVNERLPAISSLGVVIEGSDNEGIKRFVDALAPEIQSIGPPLVGVVDAGVQESRRFFDDHAFLYAPLDLVKEVHDEILERYHWEVGKRAGTLLDEEDAPPPLTEESIKKRLRERSEKTGVTANADKKFPDGYYMSEEKHTAVIVVRTPIGAGDVEKAAALKEAILEAADRVEPARYDPAIKIGFSGNLITSAETRTVIENDLKEVGVGGALLIMGVCFLYYLRIRTVIAMVVTVSIGTAWTFGLAYLLIGHLNSSSGFLVSIVLGNGINYGIIYMARYLEARRTASAAESIHTAYRETWLPTLAAAFASACAYGSLVVTDFRGFKHFGVIGGGGMLLTWLATYLFLPALLMVSEKISPVEQPTGLAARVQGAFGRPFGFVLERAPRAVVVVAGLITLGMGVLAHRYIVDDPMEYMMRNVDNDKVEGMAETERLDRVIGETVGNQGMNGMALATDRLDQVLPLKRILDERRDRAADDHKPFAEVITIFSLLPTDQDKKLALVKEARSTLSHAHDKGFMSEEEWGKVQKLLPEDRLHTIGIDELPEQVARHFTEKDGTRGRLIYVTPADGRSVWDGRYIMEWADAIRHTELPDGSVVKGSGRSVIFADMIINVVEDAPKVIIASLILTLIVVLVAFRAQAASAIAIGTLLMAVVWLAGFLSIARVEWPWGETGQLTVQPLRLNFLNFVAVPITIGVGADYAVNVLQRYKLAGGELKRVVVETGGAVILCASTTTLGYVALTMSINRGVRSFGIAAAAGEICCLLTGVLVLPAILLWRAKKTAQAAQTPSKPKPKAEAA